MSLNDAPREDHQRPATPAPPTEGKTIRWARLYDVGTTLLSFGQLAALHRRIVELAGIRPGERILDVGCGPGRLAIVASGAAGPGGEACGIDPAPEMVELARRKAAQANVRAGFEVGVIEALPCRAGHFDVVLSSLMLHHLPDEVKRRGLAEIHRVLKPGGRVVAVDFGATPRMGSAISSACCGFGRGGITPSAFGRWSVRRALGPSRWDRPGIGRWRSCGAESRTRERPEGRSAAGREGCGPSARRRDGGSRGMQGNGVTTDRARAIAVAAEHLPASATRADHSAHLGGGLAQAERGLQTGNRTVATFSGGGNTGERQQRLQRVRCRKNSHDFVASRTGRAPIFARAPVTPTPRGGVSRATV